MPATSTDAIYAGTYASGADGVRLVAEAAEFQRPGIQSLVDTQQDATVGSLIRPPELLEHLSEIEACHSIAGDAAYLLFVRVATPRALEALIRDIRQAASVNTRTTVVLQTFFENRPVAPA